MTKLTIFYGHLTKKSLNDRKKQVADMCQSLEFSKLSVKNKIVVEQSRNKGCNKSLSPSKKQGVQHVRSLFFSRNKGCNKSLSPLLVSQRLIENSWTIANDRRKNVLLDVNDVQFDLNED